MSPGTKRLVISKSAGKGIGALPPHVLDACKVALRGLAAGTGRGKKLKGDPSRLRSDRLGRAHGLIHTETDEEIQVVDVGPRGDIYKR